MNEIIDIHSHIIPFVDVSEIGMGYFEGGNAAATRSIGFTVNLAF